MEQLILQLRNEFYTQLRSFALSQSSLSHLTEEEISELESAWIDLAIWKKSQSV